MIRRTASRFTFGEIQQLHADTTVAPKPDVVVPDFTPKKLTAADLRPVLQYAFTQGTVHKIQDEVAQFYGVHPDQLRSPDRKGLREARIAHPRQMAMFLAREVTKKSYPDIGKCFGGRDHSTVIHAVKQVEKRCKTDPYVEIELEVLRERFAA